MVWAIVACFKLPGLIGFAGMVSCEFVEFMVVLGAGSFLWGIFVVGVLHHLCLRGVEFRLKCGFVVYSGFEFVVLGCRVLAGLSGFGFLCDVLFCCVWWYGVRVWTFRFVGG